MPTNNYWTFILCIIMIVNNTATLSCVVAALVQLSDLTIRYSKMINSRFLLLLVLSLAVSAVRPSNGQTSNVTFMYLTAITGGFPSEGSVPAVEIALERINADQSILPGYQLQKTVPVKDSQVSCTEPVRGRDSPEIMDVCGNRLHVTQCNLKNWLTQETAIESLRHKSKLNSVVARGKFKNSPELRRLEHLVDNLALVETLARNYSTIYRPEDNYRASGRNVSKRWCLENPLVSSLSGAS